MWKHFLTDKAGTDVEVNSDTGEDRALVVATRDHKTFASKVAFLTNATYGREMNQNGAFGSVSWTLHDGTDTTRADSGTADTNTLNHIIEAAQNFASTVCVGMTAHNTDDNIYGEVTVVNSDTDLTCDADVCPDGNEAYAIAPAWTFSEVVGTKWVEDSAAQAHAGTKSLLCNNANVNDIMQLQNVNAEDIDLSNFIAISMWVYVDKDWVRGDSVSLYAMVGGAQEGDKVNLENYFDYTDHDTWHYIDIPLTDMSISASTIDSLRFENEARAGAKSPLFYLDEITLQSSGASIAYSITPDKNTWLYIDTLHITMADALAGTLADGTMPALAYDKFLGMTPEAGLKLEVYRNNTLVAGSSLQVTDIGDMISLPNVAITNSISDGTNTLISLERKLSRPIILKAEELDELRVTLEDDFSVLLLMRFSIMGYTETR